MGQDSQLHSVLKPLLSEHEGMSLQDYHAHPAMSAHNLMDVQTSPQLASYNKSHPKEMTAPMLRGHIIHDAVEDWPGFHEKYAVAPDVDRRTKEGKEKWKIFEEASGNRTVITKAQEAMAQSCSYKAWEHPEAKLFLENAKFEKSGFGQVLQTRVKARPDLDCSKFSGDLVDIKSRQLGQAHQDAWLKDFFHWKTYIQAGLQVELWRQLGYTVNGYYYILIEHEPPYQVNVIGLDKEWIEIGITEVYRAVQLWQRWESNVMPTGYGTGHDLMTVPQWMMNRLQYP